MGTKSAQQDTTPRSVRRTASTVRSVPASQHRVEQELVYLERWKAAVAPVEREAHAAGEGALRFARTALTSAFLLNGGAMVMLPLLVQLGNAAGAARSPFVLVAMVVFAMGLLLAGLGAVCGYFAMTADVQRLHYVRESRVINLAVEYQAADNDVPLSQQRAAVGAQIDKWFNRKRMWQSNAIHAVILALLAFAAGAYCGVRVLLG